MKKSICIVLALVVLPLAGCGQARSKQPDPQTLLPDVTTMPLGTPIPEKINAPVLTKPQLIDLQMLNELDGWGLTESAILRTNTGGQAWHNVTPPDMDLAGYGIGTAFIDSRRGFVIVPDLADPMNVGTLYRTEDGGETWASNPVPFGNAQMRFFDFEKGWALASLGVAAGSNAVATFQTTDGGKTWDRTFTNHPQVAGSSEDIPMGGLKGVFFPLNMETAWVGGVIYAPGTVYLYRTDDGGRHWKPVPLKSPVDSQDAQLSIEDIQFVTATDGFLSMQVTQNAILRVLYVTHDAGDTWELLPTSFANARAADFVSPLDGFIFDGEQFQVTQDGGESWTQVEPDVVFSESFMHMDFVNAETGWITAMDPTSSTIVIYKTTDGGATWLPQ